MIAGVDYDSHGVYIATLWNVATDEHDAAAAGFDTFIFRKRHGLEARADFAFDAVKRLPVLLESLPPMQVVFVERGYGSSFRSAFVLGRVQGVIVASLARTSLIVNELSVHEWKKELTGNGNAKKAEAHEALAARFHGQMPDDENMRDALAIAYVGRELNRRASA